MQTDHCAKNGNRGNVGGGGHIMILLVVMTSALGGCVVVAPARVQRIQPPSPVAEGLLVRRAIYQEEPIIDPAYVLHAKDAKGNPLHDDRIGDISDIRLITGERGEPHEIVVAGSRGAAYFDPTTLALRRRILFNPSNPNAYYGHWMDHRIVDLNGDGSPEFVEVHWAGGTAAVCGPDGEWLWKVTYPPKAEGPKVMAIADFSGDGSHQIVIGGMYTDAFRVWASDGTIIADQKWDRVTSRDEYPFLIADVDGKPGDECIYMTYGEIVVRNMSGELARKRVHSDSMTPVWQRVAMRDSPEELWIHIYLSRDESKLVRIDRDLSIHVETVPQLPPHSLQGEAGWLGNPPVEYDVFSVDVFDGAKYYFLWFRSMDGELRYREVFFQEVGRVRTRGAMLALPAQDGRPTRWLVGWGATLWLLEPPADKSAS